jgi:methylaspartate ammonia-lyase
MNNEEILKAGVGLSTELVVFICDRMRKIKYETTGDRDGVILCALIRVLVSKIIHRSVDQEDADQVFENFVRALRESYEDVSFEELNRGLH